jgi:paraquat-inducible protein B
MADSPHLPRTDDLPEAIPRLRNRAWPRLVWIVPIVAAIIAGWLGLRTYFEKGPEITITFQSGEGLEAGKSRVRYKEVDVGTVTRIGFTNDRSAVIVKAELRSDAKALLVSDSRFWVVRPRFSGGQAFGLSTLLSGAYISMDAGSSRDRQYEFKGLETPPIVTTDVPGTRFVLQADALGWTAVGAPVYYRGIRVGQIVSTDLAPSGSNVLFHIFVNAPYDQYVTTKTRFWDAGGVNLSLDAQGLHMDTESLFSILFGGVSFQTFDTGAKAVKASANSQFQLFKNRDEATRQPATAGNTYVLYFKQSIRGLSVGAPVDFRGLNIGEVTRLALDYDPKTVEFRSVVEISVFPERFFERLRNRDRELEDTARHAKTLQRFVDRGLRAQLRPANLLTGQQYVALDFFPEAPKVKVSLDAPLEIPTLPGGFQEIQTAVTNVLNKLQKVPLEELSQDLRATLTDLRTTLGSVNRLATQADADLAPELRRTIEQARSTLDKLDRTLSEASPLSGSVRGTLRDVSRAADSIRNLADYLERHPEAIVRGKKEERKP